jgi:hypothetical protein
MVEVFLESVLARWLTVVDGGHGRCKWKQLGKSGEGREHNIGQKTEKKKEITLEKRKPFEYNCYYILKLLETSQQNSDEICHKGSNENSRYLMLKLWLFR